MNVYVGRWDLLSRVHDGINWLYEATRDDILREIGREIEAWANTNSREDNMMGVYTIEEFEDTFNGDDGELRGCTYWIKFF